MPLPPKEPERPLWGILLPTTPVNIKQHLAVPQGTSFVWEAGAVWAWLCSEHTIIVFVRGESAWLWRGWKELWRVSVSAKCWTGHQDRADQKYLLSLTYGFLTPPCHPPPSTLWGKCFPPRDSSLLPLTHATPTCPVLGLSQRAVPSSITAGITFILAWISFVLNL